MAVIKLDTGAVALPGAKEGGSSTTNIVLGILLTAGVGYVLYKYVYLPYKVKKDAQAKEPKK